MIPITEQGQTKIDLESLEAIKDPELFRNFVEQNWHHIRHLVWPCSSCCCFCTSWA